MYWGPRPKPNSPIRMRPKTLNPADAARAGAVNDPPVGRPAGGIKSRPDKTGANPQVQVAGANARVQQIAEQRQQDLSGASASVAEMNPAERAAAEQRLAELRRNQAKASSVIGAFATGSRTPPGRLPGTPGRNPGMPGGARANNRSPHRGDGRRGGGNRGGGDRGGGYDGGRRRGSDFVETKVKRNSTSRPTLQTHWCRDSISVGELRVPST